MDLTNNSFPAAGMGGDDMLSKLMNIGQDPAKLDSLVRSDIDPWKLAEQIESGVSQSPVINPGQFAMPPAPLAPAGTRNPQKEAAGIGQMLATTAKAAPVTPAAHIPQAPGASSAGHGGGVAVKAPNYQAGAVRQRSGMGIGQMLAGR